MSPWRWVALGCQIDRLGRIPFVATVSGFVVLGADIVGLGPGSELSLAEPGSWFDPVSDGRLPTGPGRPWFLYLGPLTPGLAEPRPVATQPNLRATH